MPEVSIWHTVDAVFDPIDGVKYSINAVKNRINAVLHPIVALKNHINAVKNRITEIKNRIDAVKNCITEIKNRNDAVKNRNDDIKNRIDDIKNRIDTIQYGIGSINFRDLGILDATIRHCFSNDTELPPVNAKNSPNPVSVCFVGIMTKLSCPCGNENAIPRSTVRTVARSPQSREAISEVSVIPVETISRTSRCTIDDVNITIVGTGRCSFLELPMRFLKRTPGFSNPSTATFSLEPNYSRKLIIIDYFDDLRILT